MKSTEEPVECLDNILVDRLNRLETSSKDWKKRVEQKDTTNFTVAGKMQNKSLPPLTPVLQSVTPRSSLDKSSAGKFVVAFKNVRFTLTSGVRLSGVIKKKLGEELSPKLTGVRRSLSMSDSKTKSYLNSKSEKVPLENGSNNVASKEKTVNVPIMIDDDFDKFFGSSIQTSEDSQIGDMDFDHLKSTRCDLWVQFLLYFLYLSFYRDCIKRENYTHVCTYLYVLCIDDLYFCISFADSYNGKK